MKRCYDLNGENDVMNSAMKQRCSFHQDENRTGSRPLFFHLFREMNCIIFLLVVCVLFCLLQGETAYADDEKHTTTVMVYMCGSNLESRFGAATRDISEMMASGLNTDYTKVILMVGGSAKWNTGFPSDKTCIVELGEFGFRPAWRSEKPLNMAEGDTLSTFLEYGFRNYASERYALILWDHGGGPNEGVCYDELFHGKSLGLREIQEALQTSTTQFRKLDWIGMDACLMSSIETAYTLSPYAGYLVASQEEEPSTGWNYSFLKGLEDDRSAEKTAERIIDAYFSGAEQTKEKLTLSCIDLSKVKAVGNAMDEYFENLYTTLDVNTFSELSRNRNHAKSFGRADYNDSADYDLVDMAALLRINGEDTAAIKLNKAIADAVIYEKNNTGDACGISLYHPSINRASFAEKWGDYYEQMFTDLSRNYVQYLKSYGQILIGDPLESWADLIPERYIEDNGSVGFRLHLTEGQREHFEQGTLLLVHQIMRGEDIYQYIWETDPVTPDSDGVLQATCPEKALFVVDNKTGEILAGPIDYLLPGEMQIAVPVIYWDRSGILDPDQMSVLYSCTRHADSDELTIDTIQVFDNMTQTYSFRTDTDQEYIDAQDYVNAVFVIGERSPTRVGNEVMGFTDWEDGKGFYANTIELPSEWHFEIREFRNSSAEFAVFQITDTQNRSHSSELVRVNPETVTMYPLKNGTVSMRDNTFSLECLGAEKHDEDEYLSVRLRLRDLEQNYYGCTAEHIILNGQYMIYPLSASAWNGNDLQIIIPLNQIYGIKELYSIEFDLNLFRTDYSRYGEEYVRLTFPNPVPVENQDTAILASAITNDGLSWDLQNVEFYQDGSIRIYYTVTNPTRQTFHMNVCSFALEGWQKRTSSSWTLPPHGTVSTYEQFERSINDTDSGLRVWSMLDEPLASLGTAWIQHLTVQYQSTDVSDLYGSPIQHMITVNLNPDSPLNYKPVSSKANQVLNFSFTGSGKAELLLEKNNRYTDSVTGLEYLSLGFWFRNLTDVPINIALQNVRINGEETSFSTSNTGSVSFELMPGMASFEFIHIQMANGIDPETLCLELVTDYIDTEEVIIQLADIPSCN